MMIGFEHGTHQEMQEERRRLLEKDTRRVIDHTGSLTTAKGLIWRNDQENLHVLFAHCATHACPYDLSRGRRYVVMTDLATSSTGHIH